MKLISKSLFAGISALVLAPLSALPLPPNCDDICVDFEACNTTCAVPWTTRIINCGIWQDLYHQPGSCVPALAADSEEEELMSSEPTQDVNASREHSAQ